MAGRARVIARIVAVPLAAAFAFFGYFKTFASRAVLEQHHAWTIALPDLAGRLVGVSELVTAAVLLLAAIRPARARLAIAAASYAIVNQAAAALVHVGRGETGALPQNAVLAALALIVALGFATRPVRPT
jgi:hypothetical protein